MERTELQELLSVSSKQTLEFFFTGLREIVPDKSKSKTEETLYVASILASYAYGFFSSNNENLTNVNPSHTFTTNLQKYTTIEQQMYFETSAARVILYGGFCRRQIQSRKIVSVRLLDHLGQKFFSSAAALEQNLKKRELLTRMSDELPMWNNVCMMFNQNLRENRYLIN